MTDLDEMRARQEALETANETLHEAFKTVDGDAHTALQVARQNIKLMTALRETQLAHGNVIAGLVTEVADVKTDVAGLKTDVAGLKTDVAEMKADLMNFKAEVRSELVEVRSELVEVRSGLTEVRSGLTEVNSGVAEMLRRLPA